MKVTEVKAPNLKPTGRKPDFMTLYRTILELPTTGGRKNLLHVLSVVSKTGHIHPKRAAGIKAVLRKFEKGDRIRIEDHYIQPDGQKNDSVHQGTITEFNYDRGLQFYFLKYKPDPGFVEVRYAGTFYFDPAGFPPDNNNTDQIKVKNQGNKLTMVYNPGPPKKQRDTNGGWKEQKWFTDEPKHEHWCDFIKLNPEGSQLSIPNQIPSPCI